MITAVLLRVVLLSWTVFTVANHKEEHHEIQPNKYHLRDFFVDPKRIAVTGFSFNEIGQPASPWLQSIFGRDAVFWKESPNLDKRMDVNLKDKIEIARQRYRIGAESLPPFAEQQALCSVEILTYVRIHQKPPFRGIKERTTGPSVGVATLRPRDYGASHGDTGPPMHQWTCIYRAVYTGWRPAELFDEVFWAVMVYCPVPTATGNHSAGQEMEQCNAFTEQYAAGHDVNYELRLAFLNSSADGELIADFDTYRDATLSSKLFANDSAARQSNKLAVCTAWPYLTSDYAKERAMQAMIYEFLRYYSSLGIKMFVYDVHGANMKGVFTSDYAKANPQRGKHAGAIDQHLVYHNYTLMTSIYPNLKVGHFDNSEGVKLKRTANIYFLDNDKTTTLTHCRFIARSKYGIDKVLVVDFDEFLFCKGGGSHAYSQRKYMDRLFNQREEKNSEDELCFPQTVLRNRAIQQTERECIIDEVERTSSNSTNRKKISSVHLPNQTATGSIFNCFPESTAVHSRTNVKCLHLRYKCPLTNFHHACGLPDTRSTYDCICNSYLARDHCSVLHLSVKNGESAREKYASWKDEMIEIWQINNES